MLFPEARSEQVRQRILTSELFAAERKRLEERRALFLHTPLPELPFHEYERFFRDGNRSSFEALYFARRERLSCLTAAALLYGRREDLAALEDLLWAVCGEYSWVLPAHAVDLETEYDRGVIDLFSAETGFALSEIRSLLADRLSPKVSRRILDCLKERIIEPYLSRTYFWEQASHNWAAVCGGSVGAVFLYAAPEKLPLVRQRLLHTMERYLSGFGEDGICQEGLGYWNYGFGFYTFFAQLLLEFSDGQDDLFAHPLCPAIAAFQEHAFLQGNHVVSFSDGSRTGDFQPGLTCRLRERFGVAVPSWQYAAFQDNCFRIQPYLRNLFWTDQGLWTREPEPAAAASRSSATAASRSHIQSASRSSAPTVSHSHVQSASCSLTSASTPSATAPAVREQYFPQAQWYLAHSGAFSLAAKAGHNDEPHNHNDVGSFLLLAGDETVLCDFGAGEYTAGYFRPESRYDELCNSSLGHSLPIIDGQGQQPGRTFRGTVLAASGGEFRIEIAGAYDSPGLVSAVRCLKLTEDGLLLTDRFAFASKEFHRVTERFVTLTEPCLTGGVLTIGGCRLEYDPAATPRLSQAALKEHDGSPATLYLIDFDWNGDAPFRLRIVRSSPSAV